MRNIYNIIRQSVKKTLNETQNPIEPIDIYLDLMRYFESQSRFLKQNYRNKLNKKEPITWEEIDQLNDKIHYDLDTIMTRK